METNSVVFLWSQPNCTVDFGDGRVERYSGTDLDLTPDPSTLVMWTLSNVYPNFGNYTFSAICTNAFGNSE